MDSVLIQTLLQSGAIGIIAYLLIQQLREQAHEHREELAQLIAQNATALETVAGTIQRAATAFESLEHAVSKLEERAADGHDLRQLRQFLAETHANGGLTAPPLGNPTPPLANQQEEKYDG